MEFHTLSRKELQALCKKNKIPANLTNVAMADSLAALPQVEGLDEYLNPKEGDAGTPDIRPRTACRTSTQRKARNEPESSKVSSRIRRGTTAAGTGDGVVEQENKDSNVPVTPAAMLPSSRRRGPAPSTRRTKKEAEIQEEDEDKGKPKTAAAAPRSRTRATGRSVCAKNEISGGASLQQAYSTRRSVRLVGKSLSKMSLMDTEDEGLPKIDDVSEELSAVSEHVEEDSYQKGASLQTVSSVVSEKSEDLEVSSLNNSEYECRSQEEVSENVNEMEAELQAEKQVEDSGNVNDMEVESQAEKQEEISENVNDLDSNLKVEGSFETYEDSAETGSNLLSEFEESCDSTALENKESVGIYVEVSQEAFMEVPDQDIAALTVMEVPDQDFAALTVAAPGDSCVDDVAGSLPMLSVDDASVSLKEFVESNTDYEGSNEDVASAGEHQGKDLEAKSEYSSEAVIESFADEKASMVVTHSEESRAGAEFDVTGAPSAVLTEMNAISESFEAEIEHPEESSRAGIEFDVTSAPFAVVTEKDASSEAVIEVCNASLADEKESMEVENVKKQEDSSKELEAEEPEEPAAGEDIETMPNANMMKENLSANELQNMSMRGLKKKLRQKFAGPEEQVIANGKVQEVEKKRTALQALPQNLK